MRIEHPIEWGSDGDENQSTLNPTTGGLVKYDKMKDREELAKMIALGCLPFSFASSSYLIMYIQRITILYLKVSLEVLVDMISLDFMDNIKHTYVICLATFLVEFL